MDVRQTNRHSGFQQRGDFFRPRLERVFVVSSVGEGSVADETAKLAPSDQQVVLYAVAEGRLWYSKRLIYFSDAKALRLDGVNVARTLRRA